MGLLELITESNSGTGKAPISEDGVRLSMRQTLITENSRIYEEKYVDRWRKLSEDFESPDEQKQYKAAMTIKMVENTRKLIETSKELFGEAVVQASLGALNPRVLDVVRIFYPNQIAADIVDIQPLNGQIGQIFVMKPRYGGPVSGVPGATVGNQMFLPSTYPTYDNYASEYAYTTVGTGNGSTTTFAAVLGPLPVRPNTVVVTATVSGATVTANDNGSGTLTGTGISSGTVNYNTGALSITFSTAPDNTTTVLGQIQYSSEIGQDNIRSVDFDLSLIPVQAKIHPLKYQYSVASGLAASAHLAIDVQDVLTNTAATYLKIERDNNIVRLINGAATHDSDLDFNADMTGKNYDKRSFFGEIEIKVDQAISNIQNAVGRGGLDFIIAGTDAANVFAQCRSFVPEPVRAPIGSYRYGTLRNGTIVLIKSLTMNADTYIFGFKGYMAGDAATILAEWIPFYSTPLFQNPTLNNLGGMCSLYDLFVNNSAYYRFGTLSNYNA